MSKLHFARSARNARILSVAGYRPRRSVPNAEIVEAIDSSDEWIRSRSGIAARRIAGTGETVVSMSVMAAQIALERAGIQAAQVDTVIVATVSHLYQTPSAAALVADQLGTDGAAAFDISAACAGFCHGVALADSLVRSGAGTFVMVVGVERLSDITDPADRGTAFIFADGAGAALVGPSDEPGIGPVVWGSDGSRSDLITQKESWEEAFAGDKPTWPHLTMKGAEVFRWASFEMAKVAQQALDAAGVTRDDLDAFVPHQANMRITDAMARGLHLPARVAIARDIADQGNTSAASVPLALARMLEDGHAKTGDLALIIGFGAGLSYAAQVVVVP